MKRKTKCLIVDDEPLAIEVLKSHISKLDTLEIVGTAEDAIKAFDFLNKHKVDLMFLDINMPEMKGTELVKSLKNPPVVIFTTAYREYAIEGYELNVLDYLLKPISLERLMQAIEKYYVKFNDIKEVAFEGKKAEEKFLYLREKNVIHKVPVSEIIYVESMKDNLTVHTVERSITIRSTISSIEELLAENGFIRIHRSFLVSLKRITSYSPIKIYIGKLEFPVGKSYQDNILKQLDYNSSVRN